jgi:GT2 family glycosyltransferase
MSVVSIILTTYNCLPNLKKTLNAIENQDYQKIEIIIKDGGSDDGTVSFLKDVSIRSRYPLKWVSSPDSGIYEAMNAGYKMSSGDIIVFINDLLLNCHVVSMMVGCIEEGGYDGAHADLIYADDEKVKRYWHMGQGKIRNGWMPGHPTLFLKRSVYEKYGLYDTSYKCSADYEFMVRILKDNKIKIGYMPQTIIRMYYGGTSTNGSDAYFLSLKEAHRGLRENNMKFPYWTDFLRSCRVMGQFICAGKYKGNINGEW